MQNLKELIEKKALIDSMYRNKERPIKGCSNFGLISAVKDLYSETEPDEEHKIYFRMLIDELQKRL